MRPRPFDIVPIRAIYSGIAFTPVFSQKRTREDIMIRRFLTSSVVFAALSTSPFAQQLETAATLAFTEGPAVDRDGNVYFTDIISQRIMKLGTDGALSVYREKSNLANGLLIDPQGRLIACEGAAFERPGVKLTGTPRVTRTDLKTGKIEVLADRYEGKPLVGPNDVTIDGKGRLYFTDLAGAAVYRIDAPGKIARILAAPDLQRPNGIQVSPDDREALPDRVEPGAGWRAADSLVRPAAGRHRPQHEGALQLLSGPQRRRHEHRHAGEPLCVRRHESAARELRDARQQGRHLRHLAGRASC